MKLFLLKLFTWWNGQTFGTQLWTWRFGELVGEDEQGNRYYRTKGRKIDPALGFERRWVVYNGYAEATRVPPSWHGWLHHTVDVAPTEETYKPREWEKPHVPNMTGTPASSPRARRWPAAAPQGHRRYQPWAPGNELHDPRHSGARVSWAGSRATISDSGFALRAYGMTGACE